MSEQQTPEKRPLECDEVYDLLSEYLDGEVAEQLRHLIDLHLGDCEPCCCHRDTLEKTIAAARHLPGPALPRGLRDKLLRALHERLQKE